VFCAEPQVFSQPSEHVATSSCRTSHADPTVMVTGPPVFAEADGTSTVSEEAGMLKHWPQAPNDSSMANVHVPAAPHGSSSFVPPPLPPEDDEDVPPPSEDAPGPLPGLPELPPPQPATETSKA
jgi:hypothetical protein